MAEAARVQTYEASVVDLPMTGAPRSVPTPVVPAPASDARVFVADDPRLDGDAAVSPAVTRLAELIAHRSAEGPITVAVLGPSGSGKSRALSQMIADAAALSRGSDNPLLPYLPGLVTVWIDAGDLRDDPRATIAERLHTALSEAAPEMARDAAEEANHSAGDPHARLQALSDSLDTARRRLDAERRARDEAESRRARLVETILHESAGSRVDAYARANRSSIEASLSAFGFPKDDPLATYKGLVHTLSDAGGPVARILASAKAVWAYKGQTKLIVWAVLFLLAAWAFGTLASDPSWLNSLRGQGETARTAADRIAANGSWLIAVRHLCLAAAALCAAACVWRAVRFSRPLLRGASLVDDDLSVRRGEIDNLVAHHAQRVEALTGETDKLSRRTIEAERRVVGAKTPAPAFLAASDSGADRSRQAYLETVDARLAQGAKGPARIVVALDELDTLAPSVALATLDRATAALRGSRFALVSAFDDARLVEALGPDAQRTLERLVQVPFHVDQDAAPGWTEIMGQLSSPRLPAVARSLDSSHSALDAPLATHETDLLAKLAPLAGPSPRNVKRFFNLYRLGRQDALDLSAPFAFALALTIGGTPEERSAVAKSVRLGDGASALHRDDVGRLRGAIDAANAVWGRPMTVEDARRARALAAKWSFASSLD